MRRSRATSTTYTPSTATQPTTTARNSSDHDRAQNSRVVPSTANDTRIRRETRQTMIVRRILVSFAVLGAWLVTLQPAAAHRVDEYLQATRLSIDIQRVDLEIDLTAGVAVASEVFAWIDTNRDGEISNAEGEAYARQM